MADKKFAGYICTGCGIGERLNRQAAGAGRHPRGQDESLPPAPHAVQQGGRRAHPQRHRQRGCDPRHARRLLSPREGRGLQLHGRRAVPRQPARRRDLAAPGGRRAPGNHAGDGRRLRPHGLRRGAVHDAAKPVGGAGPGAQDPRRRRRHHRHDRGRRGGRGRLRGAHRREDRRARRSRGAALPQGADPLALRRPRGHGRRCADREGFRRARRSPSTSTRASAAPRARPAASRWTSAPSRATATEHFGAIVQASGFVPVRRRQAARARLRQDQGRA